MREARPKYYGSKLVQKLCLINLRVYGEFGGGGLGQGLEEVVEGRRNPEYHHDRQS